MWLYGNYHGATKYAMVSYRLERGAGRVTFNVSSFKLSLKLESWRLWLTLTCTRVERGPTLKCTDAAAVVVEICMCHVPVVPRPPPVWPVLGVATAKTSFWGVSKVCFPRVVLTLSTIEVKVLWFYDALTYAPSNSCNANKNNFTNSRNSLCFANLWIFSTTESRPPTTD